MAAGRAAGAAAGRLAAFVGRLSSAGLVSRRNACTEVDLKKAAALTEEISKVLKESPAAMTPLKIRGLVEELSKACGYPSIESRVLKLEVSGDLHKKIAFGLYTLFGAAIMAISGAIQYVQVRVDHQNIRVSALENSLGPLPIVVSIPKEGIPISSVTQSLTEEVTSSPDPKPEAVSLTPKASPSKLEKEVTAGPDPKAEPVSLTPKGGWISGWSFWRNERA